MKKILIGAIITLAAVLIYQSWMESNKETALLKESSMLIEQQIKNVSKLVVTEGHFAEVYNYQDSKELFGPLVTADKKALVVVNAKVSISYDLKQLGYELDNAAKTLTIKTLPEAQIDINPDFEYYDVTADYFNPFDASDYNTIKSNVNRSLLKKIRLSKLQDNAKNRLLSELASFLPLTNTLGWTLIYKEQAIQSKQDLLENPNLFIN
ncbi:Hypothetical protein I595_2408 [Croceitalea dokdonensis DOKDO 023]|uniref:DUF4230 domain-containing protein n=1 Tax=Croceitalea dokdonensis DOKDO 023 TaxID=1300341 RepID=A0A0P7AZV0_9FLAO|nr:DUF4230 domain-containing protein [Croceitalea dokdonensis]KPM31144.1 Hypothetical protein I595_2408 [Croceitalea dokdonensis DOKDO 023]